MGRQQLERLLEDGKQREGSTPSRVRNANGQGANGMHKGHRADRVAHSETAVVPFLTSWQSSKKSLQIVRENEPLPVAGQLGLVAVLHWKLPNGDS